MIENYVKNIEHINSENIETSCFSQLKFYSKIIGILYLMENTDMSISLSIVESILNVNYIFNNVLIVLKSYAINRCFNVGSYITTIQGMNRNPSVSQYKNCWK